MRYSTRALAAFALTLCAPANSAIVGEDAGKIEVWRDLGTFYLGRNLSAEPGKYKAIISFDTDTTFFSTDLGIFHAYNYYCGADQHWCGGNDDRHYIGFNQTNARTWTSNLIELAAPFVSGAPPGQVTHDYGDHLVGGMTDVFIPRVEGAAVVSYKIVLFAVPEPATWAMMITGFAFAGAVGRMARRGQRATISMGS